MWHQYLHLLHIDIQCFQCNVMLSERHRCESAERIAVESLGNQLNSQQEMQEFQQPLCDLKSKLSVTSSDVIARRNECKLLEDECQKLLSSNNDYLSEKIARKR